MNSPLSDVDALEHELRLELERFEHILDDDFEEPGNLSIGNISTSISAFELAEAEGEKEFLHDRLHTLLARNEDHEKELCELETKMHGLMMKNEELRRENETLKQDLKDMKKSQTQPVHEQDDGIKGADANADIERSTQDYSDLEYRLAETRSKFARAQQALEDQMIAREFAEKELAHERLLRIHAEKERDAYSAAYEASLKHFEKWTQKKQQKHKDGSNPNSPAQRVLLAPRSAK